MLDYEILLMLDPELPEERQTQIVTRMRELIEGGGGTWTSHDVWGRRRLAYEIDKKTDGGYHLVTFTASAETLEEVSRILRITDGVMRHMPTRRVKGGRTSAPPAYTPAPPERGERERGDRDDRRRDYAGANTRSQTEEE